MLKKHRSALWIIVFLVSLGILSEQTLLTVAQQRVCPDAPPSFLTIGNTFSVASMPSGRTMVSKALHAAPGLGSKIVYEVDLKGAGFGGDSYQVIGGPVCKDNYVWWQVNLGSTATGWIAEGDSTGYYVPYFYGKTATPNAAVTIQPTPTLPPLRTDVPTAEHFATFDPGKAETAGKLQPYTIAPNLANVVISAELSQEQTVFLQRNGFVISPGSELEFYGLYEQLRYNYLPQFITTDSMLHAYHLVFDKVLRSTEEIYLFPLVQALNQSLVIEADRQYQALKGTDWQEAARRTVAFVALASRLSAASGKASDVPEYVKDLVDAEMKNIEAATQGRGGFALSAIFPDRPNGEDWSQYIPRGHYTKNEQFKAYFQTMMWYGRMTFRLTSPDETKSALLLALAVRDANVAGQRGTNAWADLYNPTAFFVGLSDSLTIPQYLETIDQVYGANADMSVLRAKGVEPFITAAHSLTPPGAFDEIGSIDAQAKGLRLMGQRFTIDGAVLRQLVYANISTADKPRLLPSALDVFAAMGSDRALQILASSGQSDYANYQAQMDKLRIKLGKLDEAAWTKTLYGAWLYTLGTLNNPFAEGYPSFMTNAAYQDRNLSAALGSYAELKHDTTMYASQSYAEGGGPGPKGPPPDPIAPPNYVEPVPLFWARLAALAEMTTQGLSERKMLNPIDQNTLRSIADLARHFQAYSIKELNGELLTGDEQQELVFYSKALKRIQQATADDPEFIPEYRSGGYMGDVEPPQVAVVADIATGSDTALQIGVGRPYHIYVIVPIGDKLYLMQGGVFSFYEFEQPIANRLTDDAWRKMLREGKGPALPTWTASILSTKTIDEALLTGVRWFQYELVSLLWFDPVGAYQGYASSTKPLEQYYNTQLKPLAEKGQYEGRQAVEVALRSFDLKDSETAIVTTRETWRSILYDNGPTPRDPGPKVAERSSYVIDMTYTLKKVKAQESWDVDHWDVVNAVQSGQLPEWEKVSP